jgi:hypothetical protein
MPVELPCVLWQGKGSKPSLGDLCNLVFQQKDLFLNLPGSSRQFFLGMVSIWKNEQVLTKIPRSSKSCLMPCLRWNEMQR